MSHRTAALAALSCLAVGVSALGQANQGTGYLFLGPGAQSPGSRLVSYVSAATNLNLALDGSGPPGAYQILPSPDGSKFYILGTSGASALQAVNSTFNQFTIINGLPSVPTAMAISPNGKLLVVGGAEVNIISTDSNSILASNLSVPGAVVSIAISRDSKYAYVLTNNAFGSTVTTFDLTTRQKVGNQLSLTGGATGITLSPQGKLYVTATNRIFELDVQGTNLAVAVGGEIATFGDLGPLKFTPDGTAGYSLNATPGAGASILKFTVASHALASWPPFSSQQSPVFTNLVIAGNNRIFAYSASTKTLWDVTPSPFGAAESALGAIIQSHNVLGVAVSNEVPNAKYLFLTIGDVNISSTIYRIDLTTNTINLQVLSTLSSGSINFVNVPLQTAGGFYQLNDFQIVDPGGTSIPLIARVLDAQGRPVFNAPVTFSNADPNNPVTINSPTGVTDSEGYVQTTVTMPATPGTYLVNITSGTATAAFTVSVPGQVPGGGGNGGGGGTVTRVTKVAGDGQLINEFNFITQPLTALVTDLDGKPLPNVPIVFSVTAGAGGVNNSTQLTDENGLASSGFSAFSNPVNTIFQANIINATTQFGSVDFFVTSYHTNQDGSSQPDFFVVKPTDEITAAAGDLIKDAVIVQVNSANYPQIGTPIPNVGLRIADPNDSTKAGPASCEGSSLSDAQGLAHCNLRVGCLTGRYGMKIVIGEYRAYGAFINISPGAATQLVIVSGNNQTGSGGSLAPITLTAVASDGCGRNIKDAKATWKVVSGSATLEQTTTQADEGGRFSTRVRLGQTPGPIKIELSLDSNGSKVTFNLTNQVSIAGITVASGDGQTALVNAGFGQPVVFSVKDVNNNAISGAQVLFSSSVPGTVLTPASGSTDLLGQVSTTVTAPGTAGPLTITATYSGFTAAVQLTVRPQGATITAANFLNAASEAPGLAVCGLGIIRGIGLAPTVAGVVSGINPGPLPYTLGGVSITANGINVPLQAVSNVNGVQQVNFQTPCELGVGQATFVVTVNGTATTIAGVPVAAAQPGIFTYAGPNNKLYGAVIRGADGSYVTPSNFLVRGEKYYLVVTGLGQTTPTLLSNSAGTATVQQRVNLPVVVGVNNAGITASSANYLVGSVGAYLVEFTVPLGSATGPDQPLTVAVQSAGQLVFGNSIFLPGVQ